MRSEQQDTGEPEVPEVPEVPVPEVPVPVAVPVSEPKKEKKHKDRSCHAMALEVIHASLGEDSPSFFFGFNGI